jgi:phytoene desaturase (3,4-didehydrolycopene-forming)
LQLFEILNSFTDIIEIIEGLVNIGSRLGVDYRLSTSVNSITTSSDGRKATGVQLLDGTELKADRVICNADLIYAYNNLLPETSYGLSLQKRDTSCSSISFYWALSKKVPELEAHNIFLADDYKESFDSIFKAKLIPEDPSFYVNVPSRIDPTAAPDGCDAVIILVPVGHLLSNNAETHNGMPSPHKNTQDWPSIRARARKQILETIKRRTGANLEPLIIHEQVNDPITWKDAFNLDRGAILGLSHSFFNVLSFRPKTKHASIEGLYFVGASTHPGTGVPICLAGAKMVATQVLEDLNMPVPWTAGSEVSMSARKDPREIDRPHYPVSILMSQVFEAIVLALFALLVSSYFYPEVLGILLTGLRFTRSTWNKDMPVSGNMAASY